VLVDVFEQNTVLAVILARFFRIADVFEWAFVWSAMVIRKNGVRWLYMRKLGTLS
jgi:hypothetical protein